MTQTTHIDERTLFRLDFALRGHCAYVEPASLESLIALVEGASLHLGAPLLRYVLDQLDTCDAASAQHEDPLVVA